jgi:hypothetical protein
VNQEGFPPALPSFVRPAYIGVLTFAVLLLPQSDARSAAIFVNEFDAGVSPMPDELLDRLHSSVKSHFRAAQPFEL